MKAEIKKKSKRKTIAETAARDSKKLIVLSAASFSVTRDFVNELRAKKRRWVIRNRRLTLIGEVFHINNLCLHRL